jgi:hypothetical protein
MKPVRIVGAAVAIGAALFTMSTVSAMTDTTTRDSSGQITEAGDVGVYKMHVGDCINDTSAATSDEPQQVSSFKAVPCSQTHTGEVTAVLDNFYTETEYPGDNAAFNRAMDSCVTSLEKYTGTDYQDGTYDTYAVYPSKDTWEYDNDRGIVCVGLTVDESYNPVATTASIKAA